MLTRLVLMLVLGFLQYQIWYAKDGYQKLAALKMDVKREDEKQAHLAEKMKGIKGALEGVKNSTDWVDGQAREALGMIQEGEVLYVQP